MSMYQHGMWTNDTYFMYDQDGNDTSTGQYFIEWKEPKPNPLKDYSFIEQNEFTPNMETWEERYTAHRTAQIHSTSIANQIAKGNAGKLKNFKYLPLGKVEDFKGATPNYSQLKYKFPAHMKVMITPTMLDFHVTEVCMPVIKEFTFKNGEKTRNIEILDIYSESPQVSVSFETKDVTVVKPGQILNLKVMLTPIVKETVKTVIVFKLKNGYKLLYLVKFSGIANSYGIEPFIFEKPRKPSTMLNFMLKNPEQEELEISVSDFHINSSGTSVNLYHPTKNIVDPHSGVNCDKEDLNVNCYNKIVSSQFKINPKIRKAIFKIHYKDNGKDTVNFAIKFKLRDLNTDVKEYYTVPVYIIVNENEVELYPEILDFGILYANSGISHKLPIRTKAPGRKLIQVGFPFVPMKSYFEYDFSKLVATHGIASPNNAYLLGTVTLKTHGLSEGDYNGYIIFCKDKVCNKDEGKSKIYYRFAIAKDPLNAKSKMHSFEIGAKQATVVKRSYQIQLLWLKNTFSEMLRIDDIT